MAYSRGPTKPIASIGIQGDSVNVSMSEPRTQRSGVSGRPGHRLLRCASCAARIALANASSPAILLARCQSAPFILSFPQEHRAMAAALPLFQVDAFASKAFTGNPAAVCLLPGPRDA